MNNTKTTLAIVAVLTAAILVVGGTSAAMTTGHSAFAWKQDSYKKRGDDSYKNKKGQDSYSKKNKGYDSYSKKVRQDNGIYGDGNTVTIQANKQYGKQSGHDNDFEQSASNVICTHPGEYIPTDNQALCFHEES